MNMIELSGKEYRNKYLPILKEKVSKLDRKLGLVVIQVGNDEASNVYVDQKGKRALELGYNFEHKKFDENVSEEDVIKYIEEKCEIFQKEKKDLKNIKNKLDEQKNETEKDVE